MCTDKGSVTGIFFSKTKISSDVHGGGVLLRVSPVCWDTIISNPLWNEFGHRNGLLYN